MKKTPKKPITLKTAMRRISLLERQLAAMRETVESLRAYAAIGEKLLELNRATWNLEGSQYAAS